MKRDMLQMTMDKEIAQINANAMLGQELRKMSTKSLEKMKKTAHSKSHSSDMRQL